MKEYRVKLFIRATTEYTVEDFFAGADKQEAINKAVDVYEQLPPSFHGPRSITVVSAKEL